MKNNNNFSFLDGLTLVLLMLKCMGYIDSSWFFVWLPEIGAFVHRVFRAFVED